MSLAKFIEEQNKMAKLFKTPEYNVDNLSNDEAQALFSRLDSNMSPEVLHADGERSPAAARKLAVMYTKAFQELKAKGFTYSGSLYNLA